MRSPRASRRSTTFTVPSVATPSSSDVARIAIDPRCDGCAATNPSIATTIAASEVFMSAAPRPNSLPSRSVGANGSDSQRSSGPVGTTSVWPAKHTSGEAVPRRAQRLVTPPLVSGSRRKPSGRRQAASTSWQPPSSGVIERRAISSRASASVSVMTREKPEEASAPDYRARKPGVEQRALRPPFRRRARA